MGCLGTQPAYLPTKAFHKIFSVVHIICHIENLFYLTCAPVITSHYNIIKRCPDGWDVAWWQHTWLTSMHEALRSIPSTSKQTNGARNIFQELSFICDMNRVNSKQPWSQAWAHDLLPRKMKTDQRPAGSLPGPALTPRKGSCAYFRVPQDGLLGPCPRSPFYWPHPLCLKSKSDFSWGGVSRVHFYCCTHSSNSVT